MAFAKKSKYRVAIALASVTLGTALGFVAVAATFFESSVSPPNRLILQLSPEMKHMWVVLLEKPGATQSLAWRGTDLPFMSRSASVTVPVSGVVIVDSLIGAGGGYAQAYGSADELFPGQSGGPAPPGSGFTAYLAFQRPEATVGDSQPPDLPSLNDAIEFAAFLKARGVVRE
jgi:hypothetical protein